MKTYFATGYKTTEFTVKMTPEQLREIADKMEEQYRNNFVGDSTIVAQIFVGDFIKISVSYDQEKMDETRSKYR